MSGWGRTSDLDQTSPGSIYVARLTRVRPFLAADARIDPSLKAGGSRAHRGSSYGSRFEATLPWRRNTGWACYGQHSAIRPRVRIMRPAFRRRTIDSNLTRQGVTAPRK